MESPRCDSSDLIVQTVSELVTTEGLETCV